MKNINSLINIIQKFVISGCEETNNSLTKLAEKFRSNEKINGIFLYKGEISFTIYDFPSRESRHYHVTIFSSVNYLELAASSLRNA